MRIEFPLLEAELYQSDGDRFTTSCLQKIAKDFKLGNPEYIPVTQNFSRSLKDTYGEVINMRFEDGILWATIEIDDNTPQANLLNLNQKLELAAGGFAIETAPGEGRGQRDIYEMQLTCCDLVTHKVK